MTTTKQKIAEIAIDLITESPSNPRRRYGSLDEFTASVKTYGILSPILVRPDPGDRVAGDEPRFELVYGHRRHRAAQAAGMTTIPALIRKLDDREVLEVQVIENLQREDVHPLEEADGYKALHETHGYPVDEIAAKTGMSRAYIYGRMKLCSLSNAGRQAFFDGEISASVAIIIARLPTQEMQDEAVEQFADDEGGWLAREVSERVQNHYMRRLEDAPWTLTEKGLGDADACADCPKRTGNQSELFSDLKNQDMCTDPTCYRTKLDASFEVLAESMRARGIKVFQDGSKEAKKIFPYSHSSYPQIDVVNLDQICFEDPKQRTYRQVIGSAPDGMLFVQSPNGTHTYLMPRKEVGKALVDLGIKTAPPTSSPPEKDKKAMARERAKTLIEAEVRRRTITAIVEAAEAQAPSCGGELLTIVRAYSWQVWDEVRRRILERRGVPPGEVKNLGSYGALANMAGELGPDQLWGLLLELSVAPSVGRTGQDLCSWYDIDPKEIRKAVKDEHKKAKSKKKKTAKKRTKNADISDLKKRARALMDKGMTFTDTCSQDACEKAIKSRGLCSAHYQMHRRLIQQGKTGLLDGPGAPTSCTEDGCLAAAEVRGLCSSHYSAVRASLGLDRRPSNG